MILLSTAFVLAAALHEATPVDVLLDRLRSEHHHGITVQHAPPPPVVPTAEARVFTVTARTFRFDVSPLPFVVNQGDTVTLHIRSVDVTHGFFLERYDESARQLPSNQNITVQFVANQPGTFTYLCTHFCGDGHGNMFGTFTVNALPTEPAPTVTDFSPTNGPAAGGNNVVINGTGFQNGVTVRFGDTPAVAVNRTSSTSLIAVAPAHAEGIVDITVTNPDGQSGSRGGYGYGAVAPRITSLSPATVSTAGGTRITIGGSGFAPGATVLIGGVAARDVVVESSTTIAATTPIGPHDIVAVTTADVVVTNPDGQSGTRTNELTWLLPEPTLTAASPSAGAPAGGTIVTLTGAGFTTALPISVMMGGVPATNVTVVDAVTLRVTAPAHGVGTVPVVVTVGSRTSTAASLFTYANTPPRRRAARP